MPEALYDDFAEEYLAFVEQNLANTMSVLSIARNNLLAVTGDVNDLHICDLGCGEGHLSRTLAELGSNVIGIELSAMLLDAARERSRAYQIDFVQDDAQALSTQSDEKFECVVSNLVLMDIPDLQAVYQSVYRILRPGGRFVFSIMHPCFQTPETSLEIDENDQFVSRRIMRYADEGRWYSENKSGIRGQVGAEHRMLSTYLNKALQTGFSLQNIKEPVLDVHNDENPYAVAQTQIPAVLIIDFKK
ncbi:MAG: class I SAM-dependent DNA methyltransferase [Aggregatilineales bacterium]